MKCETSTETKRKEEILVGFVSFEFQERFSVDDQTRWKTVKGESEKTNKTRIGGDGGGRKIGLARSPSFAIFCLFQFRAEVSRRRQGRNTKSLLLKRWQFSGRFSLKKKAKREKPSVDGKGGVRRNIRSDFYFFKPVRPLVFVHFARATESAVYLSSRGTSIDRQLRVGV